MNESEDIMLNDKVQNELLHLNATEQWFKSTSVWLRAPERPINYNKKKRLIILPYNPKEAYIKNFSHLIAKNDVVATC